MIWIEIVAQRVAMFGYAASRIHNMLHRWAMQHHATNVAENLHHLAGALCKLKVKGRDLNYVKVLPGNLQY